MNATDPGTEAAELAKSSMVGATAAPEPAACAVEGALLLRALQQDVLDSYLRDLTTQSSGKASKRKHRKH